MKRAGLARSYLFAPGNRPELLEKVFSAGADAVVLDLEDAVPADQKQPARERVRQALDRRPAEGDPATWVRINPLDGSHWRPDLEAVVTPALAGVRVPKVESVAGLDALDEELTRLEVATGCEPISIRLTCTIESAKGLLAAEELARHPRVDRIAFGSTDFMADIGADPGAESTATLWARSWLVVACRAAGVMPPIAPVWTRLDDVDGLRRTTVECRQLGFFGRSCIHPKQIGPVHEAFTPS
ncbi:MAG: CoA ester lyase, partial [Acidobacteriota bacterium]